MTEPQTAETVLVEAYDAGLLNDFGGGNVEWWQDYIRAELGRAHEHYASQLAAQPLPREGEWVTVSREHLESLAHQLKGLGSWNSSVFQCISRGEQIGGDISAMLAAAPPPHDRETYTEADYDRHGGREAVEEVRRAWAEKMIAREGDLEVGAGFSMIDPDNTPPHDGRGEVEIPDFLKRQTGELPPLTFPAWKDDGREGSREGAEEDGATSFEDGWRAMRDRAETAEAQLADVRDAMITAMNNRDEWMELAHKTNAQLAEAKGEVERLRNQIRDIPPCGGLCQYAKDVAGQIVEDAKEFSATITTLTAQQHRLLEATSALLLMAQSIQTDVASAHANRGNGASQWMREDDNEFRSELRKVFDALRKAHDGVEGEG